MSSAAVARAAAALPPNPSREAIAAVAEIVARAALESAVKVPGRSVTQYVRHRLGDRPRLLQDEIRAYALAVVRRETKHLGSTAVGGSPAVAAVAYCTLRVAALRYGLDEKLLHKMLKWPQHRRAFGWPRCWDGLHWHFLVSAIESPASVAGLPPIEPPHHLPGWCLRVEDVEDIGKFPEVL